MINIIDYDLEAVKSKVRKDTIDELAKWMDCDCTNTCKNQRRCDHMVSIRIKSIDDPTVWEDYT